jgi:hypothetical protein
MIFFSKRNREREREIRNELYKMQQNSSALRRFIVVVVDPTPILSDRVSPMCVIGGVAWNAKAIRWCVCLSSAFPCTVARDILKDVRTTPLRCLGTCLESEILVIPQASPKERFGWRECDARKSFVLLRNSGNSSFF